MKAIVAGKEERIIKDGKTVIEFTATKRFEDYLSGSDAVEYCEQMNAKHGTPDRKYICFTE